MFASMHMGVFSSNRLAGSECTLVNVIGIIVLQFAKGISKVRTVKLQCLTPWIPPRSENGCIFLHQGLASFITNEWWSIWPVFGVGEMH
jgi:hypothetical protein